jgi:uncharacterized repeat protein (TIGR01451 family)
VKTPAWRSKLQSDTQNVQHVTRLMSILMQRLLLHLWLSLKAVWRFGLLRSMLLLPLLILRTVFFPLQWPISMLGSSLASGCRWVADGPLLSIGRGLRATVTVPVQLVSNVVYRIRQWSHESGRRCERQYLELRELGFVNAMALMPFLIVRLIQGIVLTLLAAVQGVCRWCWRGVQAGGAYGVAAFAWFVGCFSFTGGLKRVKQFAAIVGTYVSDSIPVRIARSLFSTSMQLEGSPSETQPVKSPGWNVLSRSFREQTTWVVVTATGTLGLLLMLYLQFSSTSAATDDDRPRNSVVAMNSPQSEKRLDDVTPVPIENDQQEPPVANGIQEFEPNPFATEEAPSVGESSPKAEVDPFDDPFGPEPPPAEIKTPIVEQPPDPLDDPFADEPGASLEMTVGWLERGLSFDQLPGNEFVVSGFSSLVEPSEAFPVFGQADDGWKLFDVTIPSAPGPAAARMQLLVPDLIVPAKVDEGPIDPNDVTPGPKELNVTVSRDLPEETAVGQLTSYRILVTNQGRRTVDRVTVEERLPSGFRAVETMPPSLLQDEKLVWQLGALQPDEQRELRVKVMPTKLGSVENVVTVRPVVAVLAKTIVSGPTLATLQLDVSAPFQVTFGESCVVQFKVTNTSTQQFDRVILRTALPTSLSHRKGSSLDYHLDSLGPGETRHVQLTLRSEAIGSGRLNVGLVVGKEMFEASSVTVEIVQPATLLR